MRQHESGTPVAEIVRKKAITEQTFYRWKKYAGMSVGEVRRLRLQEEEYRKLKQPVADLSLDKRMLQDVLSQKNSEDCGTASSGRAIAGQLPSRRASSLSGFGSTAIDRALPERC